MISKERADAPQIGPVCGHRFDTMVCVAHAGHLGLHITSNERFPYGLHIGQRPGPPTAGDLAFTPEEAAELLALIVRRADSQHAHPNNITAEIAIALDKLRRIAAGEAL